MKRIRYNGLAVMTLALCAVALCATLAQADGRTCPGNTPIPNAAKISLFDYNDCLTSTVTPINAYPADISIDDANDDCFGYANRHTWSFSTDGGATDAQFENCSLYRFCADVTLSGTGDGEGGLRLSSWWSPHDNGQFMANAKTGEVTAFDGRLPFFSFTNAFGLHYVKGTTIHMEIIYNPNGLSASDPAYIVYNVTYGGHSYTSGPRYFDSGNLSEAAVHGSFGELFPAYAGGYVQPYVGQGTPVEFKGDWANICFDYVSATPAHSSTWGKLKTLYR